MAKTKPFDPIIFGTTLILVIGGFLIFMSASLGLLARDGASFSSVAVSQFGLGVVGGLIALFIVSAIPYRALRPYAPLIFVSALSATLLVFIPGLGLTLNGATRWIDLGFTTFQPVEFLKIGYIVFLAAWLSGRKPATLKDPLQGLIPFSVITGLVGIILLIQPDTDSLMVIAAAGLAMFFASGATIRDIILIFLVGALALGIVVANRPYVLDRFTTFLNPANDPLGAGYQINQSLIAIGSGGIVGRGFGQSVQKFNYLPEPTSDSIFAVYAEELGFVGTFGLVIAFLTLAFRGLFVAARAPDMFGGLIAVGIVTLIIVQTFLNLGSMLALFPLSGMPLVFISHGGSALFFALIGVGILLSISRYRTP